ncbi:MAG: hypothetical protein M1817_005342 [Caeruleum heppii]|nr:MAG: hypothetical protein M1817_005342 [Caeruleum heppii]
MSPRKAPSKTPSRARSTPRETRSLPQTQQPNLAPPTTGLPSLPRGGDHSYGSSVPPHMPTILEKETTTHGIGGLMGGAIPDHPDEGGPSHRTRSKASVVSAPTDLAATLPRRTAPGLAEFTASKQNVGELSLPHTSAKVTELTNSFIAERDRRQQEVDDMARMAIQTRVPRVRNPALEHSQQSSASHRSAVSHPSLHQSAHDVSQHFPGQAAQCFVDYDPEQPTQHISYPSIHDNSRLSRSRESPSPAPSLHDNEAPMYETYVPSKGQEDVEDQSPSLASAASASTWSLYLELIWRAFINLGPRLLLLLFVAFSIVATLKSAWTFMTCSGDIGACFPFLDRPIWYAPEEAFTKLTQRVSRNERAIAKNGQDITIMQQQLRLHKLSVESLQHILPDELAVKRTAGGKLDVGQDFWMALKKKIGQDFTTEDDVERIIGGQWREYLDRNERRVRMVVDEAIAASEGVFWERALDKDVIVKKEDFVELLHSKYDELAGEIYKIRREIEEKYRDLDGDLENKAKSAAYDAASSLAAGISRPSISAAQLDALVQANMKANADTTWTKINYFSEGFGAVIDPHTTSKPAGKPSTWLQRFVSHFVPGGWGVRWPNPPIAALTTWHDMGDCFCMRHSPDVSPQIGVHTAEKVWPTELVIEHIPRTATNDISVAPDEVELWAKAFNEQAARTMRRYAVQELGEEPPHNHIKMTERWVRIGKWQYDKWAVNHVQSFSIPIDMTRFIGRIDHVVVRFPTNWGNLDHTCIYRMRLHGHVDAEFGPGERRADAWFGSAGPTRGREPDAEVIGDEQDEAI